MIQIMADQKIRFPPYLKIGIPVRGGGVLYTNKVSQNMKYNSLKFRVWRHPLTLLTFRVWRYPLHC